MFRVFRIKKNEDGQAMVEFALVLMIVLIIALGIAQFSMILSAQIAVTNAAREGARAASVGKSDATVRTVVENAIGGHGYLNIGGLSVAVSGENKVGETIKVEVTGTYVEAIVPVPSFDNFGPGSANIVDKGDKFNLSATASMRLENKR